MNFIRKKPSTPLDDLTQLYNDTCNRTVQNIAFEQKGEYKAAVQGWKGLHTNVLYKMDVLNKSFSSYQYSADELYIREGIEELDAKGLDHYERVYQLFLDSEPESKDLKQPSSSTYSVPSLRSGSPQGFAVRQAAQEQQRQPRLLKTLRAEKPHKFNSNLNFNKASEVSKMAANLTYNNTNSNNNGSSVSIPQHHSSGTTPKHQIWTTSKSLSSTSTPPGFRKSEELIDLFDRSFEDDFEDDLQVKKRNETLQQLEATALQSRLARTRTQDLLSDFEKLDIDSIPRKSSDSRSPNRNTIASSRPSLEGRPPIPKTTPIISTSPPKKSTPPALLPKKSVQSITHQKSASTSRLPTKKIISPKTISSNASIKPTTASTRSLTSSSRSLASNKPTSNQTARTTKTQPKTSTTRSVSKPTATRPTVKQPPSSNTVRPIKRVAAKPAVNGRKPMASSRSRSESPLRDETKDTETINSSSEGEEVDEMELSEKEVRAKMEDQIIEGIRGIDYASAKQIFNEIVVRGDEVHWDDIAGLETAKNSLKETVVYPFLRPDLFSGLREPARGMLLFGPPGTGKTMLARAVATESKSTFFSISASSLTSKYLGESEKLVRALFMLARELSPSIIFVDEIDSLLSSRNESGEHESSRRIKNEFLIQWSELTHAAAGRDHGEDLQRVLVLAATNLPWAIDEAARRRFVRRQYIPLPEAETRLAQITKLLAHQKHTMDEKDQWKLVELTEGYSGSDITALAKDAAMGPLRSLGDKLLSTARDEIRPIELIDFENSLKYIKPSVSKENLKDFDEWAAKFGSSGV